MRMRPRVRHAMSAAAAQAAIAYGYTLTVWSTGAVLMKIDGQPRIGDVFLFIGGAVAAFLAVELMATRGFDDFERAQSPRGTLMIGSLQFVSAGVAVGCATLVGEILNGDEVWPLASFAATFAYFMLAGIQLWLSERVSGNSTGES